MQGVIVCSGGFTKGAIDFAKDTKIELVDEQKLNEMK